MKFYLDITLLSCSGIGISFLWGKVFQQIHLAIVEQLDEEGRSEVGVSFPEYCLDKKRTIGKKIRLLTESKDSLEKLNITKWLNRLGDYVHITSIKPVPNKVLGHALYKRERVKSSLERIARRKARREGLSEEEARKKLDGFKEKYSKAPFVNMNSLGTRQRFKLFILRETISSPIDGKFGSYGFGINSSVPEF